MKQTLKMMKGIITGKEKELDEKELIIQYQNNLYDNILAYFFVNNFGMITIISNSYPNLDEQDKASFCLQELDKCLRNFKLDSNMKFITYFYSCFKNRLKMEFQQINTDKRIAQYFYLEEYDIKKYEEINYIDDIDSISKDINSLLDDYGLNSKEKILCKLLNDGYEPKEISNMFKLKPVSIYKKIRIIRKKILKTV